MEHVSPKNKLQIFQEFYKSAKENGVRRLDEEFLNRYLIGHQYDTFSALRSIQNFESFVDRRKETWLNLPKIQIEKVIKAQVIEVLDKKGLQGQTIVWIRVEHWDPNNISADEILQVSGVLCELAYSKFGEIKYIDIILDLNHLSLKHLYGLSPKFAKRMVFFMSECLPMKMLHIYVVKQPKIFYLVYSLFKPFLEESVRKSIEICGWNFQLLSITAGRDNLPIELDGMSSSLDPNRWLNQFYSKRSQAELKRCDYHFY